MSKRIHKESKLVSDTKYSGELNLCVVTNKQMPQEIIHTAVHFDIIVYTMRSTMPPQSGTQTMIFYRLLNWQCKE